MKHSRVLTAITFFLILMFSMLTVAQDTVSEESVKIDWPPPVSEVWGVGDVIGTANVVNMVYYYLEYKPLNEDLTEPANAPWIPATVAMTESVVHDSLATLDTTTVPDGVYAIRLTVTTDDNQTFHYSVAPIRVNNARFSAVEARLRGESSTTAETSEATPAPAVTTPSDNLPRVTPLNIAVNVRRCDIVDNERCPVIDTIAPVTFADVIGRNASNTWYQVRLDSGVTGWVAPMVVTKSGSFADLPVVIPSAPLQVAPKVTTSTPVVSASAFPNGLEIEGGNATCGQAFNVHINMTNNSTVQAPAGTVLVQDINLRTGDITSTGSANYPAINPNGNFVVVVPMVSSLFYNEDHELRAFTSNGQFTWRYRLQQGTCAETAAPNPAITTDRRFGVDECSIVLDGERNVSVTMGEPGTITVGTGTYPAIKVHITPWVLWYRFAYADGSLWITEDAISGYVGNCTP